MDSLHAYLKDLSDQFSENGSISTAEATGIDSDKLLEIAVTQDAADPVVRGALIHLVIFDNAESRQNVKKVLQKGDGEKLRRAIVDLLTTHGSMDHVDTFIYMIEKGSMLHRKSLLTSLAETADRADPRMLNLLHRFLLYGDQHSRLIAAQEVKDLGNSEFNEDLIYLLQKEGAEPVRLAVVDALKALHDPKSSEPLQFVAENDRLASVRNAAAEALTAISIADEQGAA